MKGLSATLVVVLAGFLSLPMEAQSLGDLQSLEEHVAEVERAFAKTMADRDHDAFVGFLSEETVFLAGTTARRGREVVAEHWKGFYEETTAPFSWEPETVSVLPSGDLAISTGPVWNSAGKRTSTYTSIWRQEEPGVWKIVFDKGNKYCASEPASPTANPPTNE